MTHIPIPEGRRRELAAFIPDLAEARRKLGPSSDAYAERRFWTEHVLDIQKMNSRGPTNAAERLWLLRHAYLAVTGADPIRRPGFPWPGFCVRTGATAVSECWPLEPIPGAKVPPSAPPDETPKVKPKRADECPVVIEGRVVKPGDTIYVRASGLSRGRTPNAPLVGSRSTNPGGTAFGSPTAYGATPPALRSSPRASSTTPRPRRFKQHPPLPNWRTP